MSELRFPLMDIHPNDSTECDLRWGEKWLAVDLDGTLLTYDSFQGHNVFGGVVTEVHRAMEARHNEGWNIAIFTARADTVEHAMMVREYLISSGIGFDLITNVKKPYFTEFWDDRARLVQKNTGCFISGNTVVDNLQEAAKIFLERNEAYGDAYKSLHPSVMQALFPNGASLNTPDDHCRFGLVAAVVGKLTRYCANFDKGGHSDSLTDGMAFFAMLKGVDDEIGKR